MWRLSRQWSRWPVARGRVIQSGVEEFEGDDISDSGGTSRRYRAAVIYSYEVDGVTYQGDRLTFGTFASSSPRHARRTTAKYPVGSEVKVHYDRLSPGESVINPRSGPHLLLWLVAAAIFAFAWALATGRLW
jgi:hypothetical protein